MRKQSEVANQQKAMSTEDVDSLCHVVLPVVEPCNPYTHLYDGSRYMTWSERAQERTRIDAARVNRCAEIH